MTLKYEEFKRYMDTIVKLIKRSWDVENALGVDGIMTFHNDILDEFTDLLERVMNDKEDQWIQYWLWELDFGERYREGSVTINGEDVPMKTILDLYNVLLEYKDEDYSRSV